METNIKYQVTMTDGKKTTVEGGSKLDVDVFNALCERHGVAKVCATVHGTKIATWENKPKSKLPEALRQAIIKAVKDSVVTELNSGDFGTEIAEMVLDSSSVEPDTDNDALMDEVMNIVTGQIDKVIKAAVEAVNNASNF